MESALTRLIYEVKSLRVELVPVCLTRWEVSMLIFSLSLESVWIIISVLMEMWMNETSGMIGIVESDCEHSWHE